MKKSIIQFLFLSFAALFFISCKKDKNTSDEYFVKVKKDGSWLSFATVAGELGPDLLNAAYTDLGIAAQTTDGKERFDLSIQIEGSNFNTGVYNSINTTSSHPYVIMSYMYMPDASTMHNYDLGWIDGRPESSYTVNITEITATTLRGTFTGNYLAESIGDGVAEITEGEFYVKRLR